MSIPAKESDATGKIIIDIGLMRSTLSELNAVLEIWFLANFGINRNPNFFLKISSRIDRLTSFLTSIKEFKVDRIRTVHTDLTKGFQVSMANIFLIKNKPMLISSTTVLVVWTLLALSATPECSCELLVVYMTPT